MSYVIGIDTGGTYTDAVLVDSDKAEGLLIHRKTKALTVHSRLERGIESSIRQLGLTSFEIERIARVVLSTTLATNAVVEGNIHKVGLILPGGAPGGRLATEYVRTIGGSVNVKGRILANLDQEEGRRAVLALLPHVESFAVSGAMSVRNPVLEQDARKLIHEICDLPVMCGHELTGEPGFLERTNTTVMNAGLLPVIRRFIHAVNRTLTRFRIKAPVFMVRGDGSMAALSAIMEKPVDTVLSGPAASMIGMLQLTGISDAIVSDMGGTTTDTGMVKGRRVELSADGASVGNWKIRIKSAKLYTLGLGGDSHIRIADGELKVGPRRVLPACRGGPDAVTPTDILHYTGEFEKWDREKAVFAIKQQAALIGMTEDKYVTKAMEAVSGKILNENILRYRPWKLPVCAAGAPAKIWYGKARKQHGFPLVIPENYEVAGAVGAATAGIEESATAVVRPGEEGFGYLAHTQIGRFAFLKKEEALGKAIQVTKEHVVKVIAEQDLEVAEISVTCEDTNLLGSIIETNIKVTARGKIFV